MLVTLTAIVALAVGVLIILLVTRRSVSDWQIHISETTSEWKKNNAEDREPPFVEPRTSSLQEVLKEESRQGSAYLRADELPAFDQRHESTKK